MQIEGIEIMNDDPEAVHVLYAKCHDPSGRVQKVADLMVDSFVSSGLMQRQYDHVKLHATLMNTLFTAVDDEERTRQTFNAKTILEVRFPFNLTRPWSAQICPSRPCSYNCSF